MESPPVVRYSQSHVYRLIEPFMPDNNEMRQYPTTQATKFLDRLLIKVVFVEDEAYWIKDNIFYVANAKDHEIQHDTAVQVDTMSMDKVQLDKIKLVVEQLTKGNQDDSRNAG